MLSYHTSLLATIGGKDTGGMNVYVRDLTASSGKRPQVKQAIERFLDCGNPLNGFARSRAKNVATTTNSLPSANDNIYPPLPPENGL
jgi:D-inositol-3-phosphate glycosyltransferase